MSLEGRVALVTGGGRGIGAGCSVCLAKAGADVALTYRKDKDSADEVVAEIESLGRKALAIQSDVGIEEQALDAPAQAVSHFGKVDILIANAGVASRGNTVRDTSTEEFQRLLSTHVMGAIWSCQGVIDSMRAEGRGHIVLISSVATKLHGANGAPYSIAKSGMDALMKALTLEEGPNGIRVNAIGPGLIETEMGRRLSKARGTADIKDLYATHPFDRVGQPEDIGNLAAFLCSEEGSYISGQMVYVDGGGFVRKPKK